MKRTGLLLVAIVLALATSIANPSALADHYVETTSFHYISMAEDRFYNWDFENDDYTTRTNVDWPVTMLFYNDADVQLVKDMYYTFVGSSMYARLNDGSDWVWDKDGGTKSGLCTSGIYHMRVYADSDDHMYNTSLGYYVIGTTNIDNNECGDKDKWSGESELTEGHFATRAKDIYSECGVDVLEDWGNFRNVEPYRYVDSEEGPDHIKDNDGYATAVYLPDDFSMEDIADCEIHS